MKLASTFCSILLLVVSQFLANEAFADRENQTLAGMGCNCYTTYYPDTKRCNLSCYDDKGNKLVSISEDLQPPSFYIRDCEVWAKQTLRKQSQGWRDNVEDCIRSATSQSAHLTTTVCGTSDTIL